MASTKSRPVPLLFVVAGCLLTGWSAPAASVPQSDGASRHSQASLAASVEVPVAIVHALGHGASAVVSGIGAAAGSVAVTISVAGAGVSFVVYLSVDAVRRLGIAVGTAVSVAAVATGWIINAAGEALCFIANDSVRPHIHSHRYGG